MTDYQVIPVHPALADSVAAIALLARDLAISPRHLERLFHQHLGVRPKEYARLVQFDWAIRHAHARTSWGALAHAAGYADQAHFIRSFVACTSTTPERFFAP
jgi:AraC-like DNA-binding protein